MCIMWKCDDCGYTMDTLKGGWHVCPKCLNHLRWVEDTESEW